MFKYKILQQPTDKNKTEYENKRKIIHAILKRENKL